MKKILLIISISIFLSGCATYYNVRVNGYLDTTHNLAPITPGASFFVLENKNASNPIFDAEIKSKIEKLLKEKDYSLQSYDKADFYLEFIYTLSSGKSISDIRPVFNPPETETVQTYTSSGKTRTSFVTFPGYTTYVPYKTIVYTPSLTLDVFDASFFRDSKERKTIWIGETANTSQNPDLREVINYLLVASFEHFGENTGKSVIVSMPEDDPRIKSILH
jgi:hypothetical protein